MCGVLEQGTVGTKVTQTSVNEAEVGVGGSRTGLRKYTLFSSPGLKTVSEALLRGETGQVGRGQIMEAVLCFWTLF